MLVELPTRDEREPVVGAGEGGDDTTAIDAAAERAIVARLEELGRRASSSISSRRSSASARSEGVAPWRVVVDPIDGSLNAKRGIPFFSISIAVADGDTMDDVVFGYVYDFGTGEEWTATRAAGAPRNGEPLGDGPRRRTRSRSSPSRRRSPRRSPTTPRRSSAMRSGSGSWARSRSRSATWPRAAWTRSSRSSRRGAWTSPRRNSSSASAASRSTSPTRRPFGTAPLDTRRAFTRRRRRERTELCETAGAVAT